MERRSITDVEVREEQRERYYQFIKELAQRTMEEFKPCKNCLDGILEDHRYEFKQEFLKFMSTQMGFRQYPESYKRPAHIKDQIREIAKIFNLDPNRALEYANHLPKLPEGAEGWFAIPRWQSIAQTYDEAFDITNNFLLYRDSKWRHGIFAGTVPYSQSKRCAKAIRQFEKMQTGDILIIPAQFGMLHRHQSMYQLRHALVPNEFGLGMLEIASMLLTNRNRIVGGESLSIDCTDSVTEEKPFKDDTMVQGHTYSFDSMHFDGEEMIPKVGFFVHWVDRPGGGSGWATGFLPEVESNGLPVKRTFCNACSRLIFERI